MTPWEQIEAEAEGAYVGAGKFPMPAYSEFMPPPYVGIKPAAGRRADGAATASAGDAASIDVDEYELAHQLEPGLDHVGTHLVDELGKLVRGESHGLSRTLLAGNPAWPAELADAATAGRLAHDPLLVILALALSRSQDDKGNDRWTLFGASHDGAGAAWWSGATERGVADMLAAAGITGDWRVLDEPGVPELMRARIVKHVSGPRNAKGTDVAVLLTFTPFAKLPDDVRAAYLAGSLTLVPTPAALVFHHHPGYAELAKQLPRATQIPLLHLFPRVDSAYAIRIPQSGWLDEHDPATEPHHAHGHKVVSHIARSHRWQRVARDADVVTEPHGDGAYTDKVSTALFATTPEAIDLYDKPLARNSQIWTEAYQLVLNGLTADRAQLAQAAAVVDRGGRFGYRMYWPPMRAGLREVFWHLPVIASPKGRFAHGPLGFLSAERAGHAPLVMQPRLLARESHVAAARLFARDPGHARHTTCQNARKLLEAAELHGGPVPRSYARSLLHCAKGDTLEAWLDALPARAADHAAGTKLAAALRACLAPDVPAPAPRVLAAFGDRAVEEEIWSTIAHLAHGEFRQKSGADGIAVNRGKHGGPAAKRAHLHVYERRDLDALGDHLHARYAALIAKHGMTGRADCVDHVFAWETDFEFPWMEGWAKNTSAPSERNIVCRIPGRDRAQAIVMGDHYDTAYMEDVFYAETGGDALRAPAAGADDNHSATTALLQAADKLLPLAQAGLLARDVWLVHLTGEEFPGDCLGARALGRAIVERSLRFRDERGGDVDVSRVRVRGAFVLDMVGHNTERDRDVFQIAPGEGAGSARLARFAHDANRAWNDLATAANASAPRRGAGRAQRVADVGPHVAPPPPFEQLALHGEVRVEWEPRSALFNTDGQVFSDLGVPVVLFMENYDISRKGYHDTHDTMENLDLDYCTAVTAIAIETVARAAIEEG
nr:M28 family peptidase [Kofleriaceae bacterium]